MKSENLKKTLDLRHELHQHPELAGEEIWTKNKLIEFIKKNTNLEIDDRSSWFYAYYHYKDGAESIAFVEDFDALPIDETIKLSYGSIYPGISHKCGHDGHAASLCGLALELEDMSPKKNIYLIFQHGEEIGLGGKEVSPIIKEKNIGEVYKIHNANYHRSGGFPENSLVYAEGINNCASTGLTIKFFGKDSHACLPEDGKNPVFALAKLINFVEDKIQLDQEDLLLATVVELKVGDKNFGNNPGYGEVSLTIRSKKEEVMKIFIKNLLDKASSLARSYGLRMENKYSDYFPEIYNHQESIEKVKKAGEKLGLNLIKTTTARSSDDFAYYTKLTKGAYFMVGNGEGYPQAHTVDFDYNDRILETCVEIFKELIRI